MYNVNLFIFISLAVTVYGEGEVVFLSKPPNVEFRGHEACDSGIVKDICSTSLGFTTYQTSEWPGLYITSPFNFAESVVVVALHGVASLGLNDGHRFPFTADSPLDDIWTSLESKVLDRFPYGENQSLVEINCEDDVRAAEISLNKGSLKVKRPIVKYLKESEDEDSSFISQISLLQAVADKIEEKGVPVDGLPDVYFFSVKGLHPVIDIYGENSNTVTEAKSLLKSTIQQLRESFEQAYQNRTLFLVLSSDSAHTRRFRRATNEVTKDRNLAEPQDENYPVFFNIFLWFTIAFIMTIIAASMATACMDPGRDSIIYRMTSTRMKKDN